MFAAILTLCGMTGLTSCIFEDYHVDNPTIEEPTLPEARVTEVIRYDEARMKVYNIEYPSTDGTCSFYDLIDGQWVEEETDYSEYFADGPLFCFSWQKTDAGIDQRENWEIVSYENGKMVSKALHRRADGSTYTITAHLTKVE